jgi:hypothetical protein
MRGSPPFRLNRNGMLLALISAAFAGEAGAAAGRVDFTTGGVTVSGQNGQARPLARGAELDSGDTVRTNDGRAQIRFTDGSYVSLQPNTDFAISDYKFEGKNDDRGFFGLVRGAMRTVTGAVGRVNRNSYRITTPTATVGIRGTGGVIQVLNDGSTLVIGTSGIWSLTNPAGSIDIPAGVSGLAPTGANQPPRETDTQPAARPADLPPPKPPEFRQGDGDTALEGTGISPLPKTITYVPLVSSTGYRVSAVHTDAAGVPTHTFVGNQSATFDATGQLTAFGTTNIGSASHADFNSDGILAWGRWIGTVNISGAAVSFNGNQGYHYVVGIPTAVMPTTGSATYSLIPGGGTAPTYMDGHTAPGVLTGATLTASFAGATTNISMNMTVAMPDRSYSLIGSSISNAGSSFSVSPSTSGCATTCSSTVLGFFAGTSAERVGIGYSVADGPQRVFGAAALTK